MKKLLSLVRAAVDRYDMIDDGDKIAVGVSGGKDSLALLYALARLRSFYPKHFEVIAITLDYRFGGMDGDYSEIQKLCDSLDVKYIVKKTDLWDVIFNIRKEKNPCSLCAKMRRGILHDTAKEYGCNKIALGHHYDDAIGTVLMGLIYGGQVQAMLPRVKAKNYEGMELIRPLYFTREANVVEWAEFCGLTFLPCDCPAKKLENDTKRAEIKQMIASLASINPQIEANIFNAVKNVDTGKLLGWRDENGRHSFLDRL